MLRIWIALFAFVATFPATAHEFWLRPDNFFLASPTEPVTLSLHVGENFTGERVVFTRSLVAAFRHLTADAEFDMRPQIPPDAAVGELGIQLMRAGTHLLVIDTHPNHIVMPADKFHAYLHDEGLDHVVRARESAGTAAMPGRERYRRNVKTLLQVGKRSDATYARRTGQTIEIVPVADPLRTSVGTNIAFDVLFNGHPLANALVKFWHNRGTQKVLIRSVTDADGKVTVTPPWSGTWMASVVHMVPARNSNSDDWDSYWGNLTFALPDSIR